MIELLGFWLVLLTAWSGLVWLVARILPERAFAWPGAWLTLIAASLAPAIIAPLLPAPVEQIVPALPITAQDILPAQTVTPDEGSISVPWLLVLPATVYLVIALFLIGRIFLTYAGLWRLAADADEDGIITSPYVASPVATALPFRAILLPEGLDGPSRNLIIRHETRHMERSDPEMTLALELLRALMWVNLPFHALIRRWRLSAELAVDTDILANATRDERRDYADLLLNELSRIRRRAVPCPSAALTLSEERSAKMRVRNILSPATGARKPALAVLIAAGLGLSAMGTGLAATMTAVNQENYAFWPDLGEPPDGMPYPKMIRPPMQGEKITCTLEEWDSFDYPVRIDFVIDIAADGTVKDLRFLNDGPACLVDPLSRGWPNSTWEPTIVDGQAIPRNNIPYRHEYTEEEYLTLRESVKQSYRDAYEEWGVTYEEGEEIRKSLMNPPYTYQAEEE